MFVKAVSLFCKTHQNVTQAEPRSISSWVSSFRFSARLHQFIACPLLSSFRGLWFKFFTFLTGQVLLLLL